MGKISRYCLRCKQRRRYALYQKLCNSNRAVIVCESCSKIEVLKNRGGD